MWKSFAFMTFLVATVLAGCTTPAMASDADPIKDLKEVAGTWDIKWEDSRRRSGYSTLTITEDGSFKSYRAYGSSEGKVWIEDGKLLFKRTSPTVETGSATLHGDVLKYSRDDGSLRWEGTRQK